MSANNQKKNIDWMKTIQFAIFCIACVGGIIIWYYGQQSQYSEQLETKYVTKAELQLVQQELNSVDKSVKKMDQDISEKLNKMEQTNREIVDLITDIRLTLARITD